MFNTLKYAKMLEEVGFSRDQAETSTRILAEVMEDKLASKQDLLSLESRLMNAFSQLELRLTLRMGAMFAAFVAVSAAIHKLI